MRIVQVAFLTAAFVGLLTMVFSIAAAVTAWSLLPAGQVVAGLAVAYGLVLPDVARDVQEHVTYALTSMCGLDVANVDVTVEELDR